MRDPQHSRTAPESPAEEAVSTEFLTHCYRTAIERLNRSFDERRPVAMVIGEGQSASKFVIGKFLGSLDEEVATVRITEACADASDLMRRIVTAVGFEPKDMGVNDLESVLRMFLSFQKGHGRRTVICMEEIQDSGWWVLDKIRKLVDVEVAGNLGLMLVVSGQPRLKALLHTRPLSSVKVHAGKNIMLSPFTMAETTEYIRRRVEGTGNASIDQAFHFQAITLLHELCAGVPDAISVLVSKCFDLAERAGLDLVTTELVKRAYELQRADLSERTVDADAETVNLNGWVQRGGRLIVNLSGEDVHEKALGQGHILIGRGKMCDIQVESSTVSRHHALISYTPDGAILADLRSTNGTFVDGHLVGCHTLVPGETITVGDCKIEYILEDERQAVLPALKGAGGLEAS
jgi:type II secretory pathway predicted ATPase ExeA